MASNLAPVFQVADTAYSIQLRPLKTHQEDAAQNKQHYAVCLWFDSPVTGIRFEIAGLTGFVIPKEWTQEGGSRELFELAKRMLLADKEYWDKQNKDERRDLQPHHIKWLANEKMREDFLQGIDKAILAR